MLYPEEVIAKSLIEDGWLDKQKAELTAKRIIHDLASYAFLIPRQKEGLIMIDFSESPPDWVEVVLVEEEDEKGNIT